jgi:hypothetical protein
MVLLSSNDEPPTPVVNVDCNTLLDIIEGEQSGLSIDCGAGGGIGNDDPVDCGDATYGGGGVGNSRRGDPIEDDRDIEVRRGDPWCS